MKAHMQEENEQLILNDVGATNVTNDDYDEMVQLPVNNQPRFGESLLEWNERFLFFCSKSKKKKKKQRRNNKDNASSGEEEEGGEEAAAPVETEEVLPEPTPSTESKKKGKSTTTEEVWIFSLKISDEHQHFLDLWNSDHSPMFYMQRRIYLP